MDVTATAPYADRSRRDRAAASVTDLRARGEPFTWLLGGSLAFGVVMIIGFLMLVLWNGFVTFIPKPVAVVTTNDGTVIAGEPFRSERLQARTRCAWPR